MTWQSAGAYAITDGRHHVAKLFVHAEPGYLLWIDGRLVQRCFPTSKAAREYAAAHEAPEPAAL